MPYLVRRALHSVLLLVGVSLITFALVDLAPGGFFDEMKLNPRISASTIAGLRSQYGLDQPLPVKYFRWLRSVAGGDCGFSLAYNSPAAPIVWVRAKNTLFLTGTATFFAWLFALPFGIWTAARPGRVADLLARGTTSTLLATPDVILAMLLLSLAVRSPESPGWWTCRPGFLPFGLLVEMQRSCAPSLSSRLVLDGRIFAALAISRPCFHDRSYGLAIYRGRSCSWDSASPLALTPCLACGRQPSHFAFWIFLWDNAEFIGGGRGHFRLARPRTATDRSDFPAGSLSDRRCNRTRNRFAGFRKPPG
jgi:hypothetical protein